jgi:hypothetical protein
MRWKLFREMAPRFDVAYVLYIHTPHIYDVNESIMKNVPVIYFSKLKSFYTHNSREREKEKTYSTYIRARCEPRHCRGAGAGMCGGMSSSPGNSTTRGESHSREQGRQICFETEVLYTSKTPKRDEWDEREGPHIYTTHTDEAFHVDVAHAKKKKKKKKKKT